MTFVTLIGLAAACLTTVAFLPQVIKCARSHSTRDISLGMYLVLASGVALWLVYGLLIGDLPLIFANFVTFVLVAIILIQKMRCG